MLGGYSSLAALRALIDFALVEVVALEDILDLKLASYDLPPTRKGEKVRVPLWLAKLFEKNGLATIDGEYEPGWLSRIHFREKIQPPKGMLSFSELPSDFYPRVDNILHSFEAFSSDPYLKDRLGQMEGLFKDILSRRMHILVEMSLLETVEPSLLKKLTPEERVLLEALRSVISKWKKFVGGSYLAGREG